MAEEATAMSDPVYREDLLSRLAAEANPGLWRLIAVEMLTGDACNLVAVCDPETVASMASVISALRGVLETQAYYEKRAIAQGNAPGHGHRIPGVWDEDNKLIAGLACGKCQAWTDLAAALAEFDNGGES